MSESSSKAWRCGVCGYVHREGDAPDWCPVCGADKAEFESYVEQAQPAAAPPRRWQCLNCNYVHEGPEPPETCPVCGAPADRFEAVAQPAVQAVRAAEAGTVVVVGAGIAGISAVEATRNASPDARILVLSKEPDLPYYRLNLTRYLADEIGRDELPIHPESWYADHRVDLLCGQEAVELRLDDQAVVLRGGRRIDFDRLVLTAGAHPFVPPLPGAQRQGVHTLRTCDDAERLLAAIRPGMTCACIGGGLLGMEAAGALARRGLDVTLLEGHDWPMPRQLNRQAGDILARQVGRKGIQQLVRARTVDILGDERVAGVRLEDGQTIEADLVLIATGVRPNSYLARQAGLQVNQGVVVDHYLTSSHPAVLAAGDVAEHRGTLYGSWHAAQHQGSIAGMNAAGGRVEFGGIPRSNTLKVLGIDLTSIGRFEPEDGSDRVVEREAGDVYYRFVFRDGRLIGSVLLGDASISAPVKRAIESRRDLSGLLAANLTAQDVIDELSSPPSAP